MNRATYIILVLTFSLAGGAWTSAADLVDAVGVKGGFVVSVGCEDGKLLASLGSNEGFVVQGLSDDPKVVAAARQQVKSAQVYGKVSVGLFNGKELPYVEDLGGRCAAEIVLLRVIAMPAGKTKADVYQPAITLPGSALDVVVDQHPIYREQEMGSLRAEAEHSLARAKKRLTDAGLSVRVEVLFGQPAERIAEYAMKKKVDLIAMSTHGRSGLSRWVFGSVTEKVLRAVVVPILLIRPPGADRYSRLPAVELKL